MQPNRFRDHSIWVWVGVVVLLVLLVAGVVFARPAWERSKVWRAEKYLIQFQQADAAGRADAADAALRAAFFLAPSHRPVTLEVARYYSRRQMPEALNLWRELDARAPLDPQDRILFAQTALQLDRLDVAMPQADRLLKESMRVPGVLQLGAELAYRRGDLETAIQIADEALTRDPQNVTNQLNLARLELSHQDPAIADRGKGRLVSLATSGGAGRIPALTRLLTTRQLEAADARLILRLSPADGTESLEERLIRLELENLADPSGRVDRVRAFARPLWDPAQRASLIGAARWLGQVGAFADIVELIPDEVALTDGELYLFRTGALGETERWDLVEVLLNNPAAPASSTLQAYLRASGAHAAGRTNESLGYWRQALTLSANNASLLQSIARQAEKRGYREVALDAWRGMLLDPRVAPRAASEVFRLAETHRDLMAQREALRRMEQMRLLPPVQRVSLALYEALLNADTARARQLLRRAGPKSGDTNLCAVTTSLLALRDNDPETASRELDPLDVDWSQSPVVWRVVRVAQLGRAGRRTEARRLAETLPVAQLTAPERNLIDPWLPGAR